MKLILKTRWGNENTSLRSYLQDGALFADIQSQTTQSGTE